MKIGHAIPANENHTQVIFLFNFTYRMAVQQGSRLDFQMSQAHGLTFYCDGAGHIHTGGSCSENRCGHPGGTEGSITKLIVQPMRKIIIENPQDDVDFGIKLLSFESNLEIQAIILSAEYDCPSMLNTGRLQGTLLARIVLYDRYIHLFP